MADAATKMLQKRPAVGKPLNRILLQCCNRSQAVGLLLLLLLSLNVVKANECSQFHEYADNRQKGGGE